MEVESKGKGNGKPCSPTRPACACPSARVCAHLDKLRQRVRIDAKATVEHARESSELRDNQHAGRQAAQVTGEHKLERVHVDGLA